LNVRADQIRETKRIAQEFIRRADVVLKLKAQAEVSPMGEYISTTRESGALRRQSMELTRALAEMRRP
jgi:hypothetical protein